MKPEEKRKLVEELVDLTVRNPVQDPIEGVSELSKEMKNKLSQRFREEQISIRLKHFEPEQLIALLDFYKSDIGKSIVASQKRISEEFAAGMQIISQQVTEETMEAYIKNYQSQMKPENE